MSYILKFQEAGFDIETAKNGAEALEKLKSKNLNPDVILLDILMPSMDGFEFLKIVKDKNIAPNSKIIVLSNVGQKEEIDKSLNLGAKDYIIKAHHTPSEVMEKIRKIMTE